MSGGTNVRGQIPYTICIMYMCLYIYIYIYIYIYMYIYLCIYIYISVATWARYAMWFTHFEEKGIIISSMSKPSSRISGAGLYDTTTTGSR